MQNVMGLLFGASWKTSLIGYVVAIVAASAAYWAGKGELGAYILAAGFAALGRVSKDWDHSNAPVPTATSQKAGGT